MTTTAGWTTVPGERRVQFLIVGTPRSGTSLVQRLACEHAGVGVPPETHVLSVLLPRLGRSDAFPLAGSRLHSVLQRYAALPHLDGAGPDPTRMYDWLAGRALDALDLLDAAVAVTTPPSVRVRGEKTPGHLHWVLPVAAARPDLGFVCVVRDPRAVSLSLRQTPWGGQDPARHGARWVSDQTLVRRLVARAGPHRVLLLRYEDVVADPADARSALGRFLGVSGPLQVPAATGLFRSGEHWKQAVTGAVDAGRQDRWRAESTPAAVAAVETVARREMARWGYQPEQPSRLNLGAWLRAGAYAGHRRLHARRLEHRLRRSGAFRDRQADQDGPDS